MMQEIFCYAALYLVEAFIAGVYLDYLFDSKRKLWLHIFCYALAYGLLFAISQFHMTVLNAISFTVVNFVHPRQI